MAAALLLTACLKVDMTIHVNDDGSGSVVAILATDPSAVSGLDEWFDGTAGDTGSELDRDKACRESQSDLGAEVGEGVRVEQYDDGTFCGIRITVPFESPEALGGALSGALDADEAILAEPGLITLERNGDGWTFELISGQSNAVEAEEIPSALANLFLAGVQVHYRVDLPGEPVDHNATAVDGTTYTWAIDISNPPERMYVTTGASFAKGSGWWKIALAVLAIVGVGTAGYWLGRRGPSQPTGPSDPPRPSDHPSAVVPVG